MSYVDDTEYAAKNLIALTMHEEAALDELKTKLQTKLGEFELNQWDFSTSDMNDDFSEGHVMAAFVRMAKAKEEADKLKMEVASLEASIGSKQMAIQAMCGSLLQLAKQGMSVVHGGLGAAPNGRLVNGIPLKDIIWQARNQALHYEDNKLHQPVLTLFSQLEQEFGSDFNLSNHAGQSRAKQVVQILGWTEYGTYCADMRSLGL